MAILTLIVFYEVVARYFFNSPLVQAQELVLLIFPWVVFLTTINITANGDHLRITFFRNLLPQKIRKIVVDFCLLLNLVFVVYMFIAGVKITIATSMARTSILLISRSWFYLALPITFAGMMVIVIMQTIQEIKKTYTRK